MLLEFVVGLAVIMAAYLLLEPYVVPRIRAQAITIGEPAVEKASGAKNMPCELRFIRVPIRTKLFDVARADCYMKVSGASGNEEMDTPGSLHWKRQPHAGVAHPERLHEELDDEEDCIEHMHEHHFGENKPVHISAGDRLKVDLFMRVKGIPEAIPATMRGERIPPGVYKVTLVLKSDSARSKQRTFKLRLGEEIDDMELMES